MAKASVESDSLPAGEDDIIRFGAKRHGTGALACAE